MIIKHLLINNDGGRPESSKTKSVLVSVCSPKILHEAALERTLPPNVRLTYGRYSHSQVIERLNREPKY